MILKLIISLSNDSILTKMETLNKNYYRIVDKRYQMGRVEIKENENSFYIYDIEKTICDIVLHRNKLDFETVIEIIKNYLQLPERNINKLMSYAKELQVERTIKNYLEVLL